MEIVKMPILYVKTDKFVTVTNMLSTIVRSGKFLYKVAVGLGWVNISSPELGTWHQMLA